MTETEEKLLGALELMIQWSRTSDRYVDAHTEAYLHDMKYCRDVYVSVMSQE